VSSEFFDEAVLQSLTLDEFRSTAPFPWHHFTGALTPDAFRNLLEDYPPRDLFQWREGLSGQYYSRPHDRWFLEYRPDEPSRAGRAQKGDLPAVWQRFIDELERDDSSYRRHMLHWLGIDRDLELRLTWHLGVNGSEVSPHIDTDKKLGTHIFYFNTTDDWDPSWGGNLLVLDAGDRGGQGRDFDEFRLEAEIDLLGNRSFLFKNDHSAWHGVRPLQCPDGSYRRLFNVVYEKPSRSKHASLTSRLQRKLARPRAS
jgi:hypothetical protein